MSVVSRTGMLHFATSRSYLAPAADTRFAIRSRLARLGVIALFCCLALATALATDLPVTVQISVIDEKSRPVEDAVVSVMLGDKQVTAASTGATGKATVVLPATGTYLLNITKTGYLNTETSVEATSNQEAQPIDVVLNSVALSQQSVDVKGDGANAVTDDSGIQQSLPTAQAKLSPTRPATLTDALPLIPGIIRAQDGSIKIAGFGEDHSALLVNSVDVTDPATGGFGLSVPIDSVQTVEVSVMPYLAQYGRFTAGVVTAETRRGGDKWDFSLNDPLPEWRIRSGHLDGVKSATPRLNVGGPIVANKLYFVEGAEYLLNKNSVRTLPYPENQYNSQAINSFTQMDWIISPTQTLTGSLDFAPHTQEYVGLNYFDPQPVTPNANFHESTETITHRWSLGGGLLRSTLAERGVTSDVRPQAYQSLMTLQPTGDSGNYFQPAVA